MSDADAFGQWQNRQICRKCPAFVALSNDNGNTVCFMRKHLFLLIGLFFAVMPSMAQSVVVPEGDSSFVTEFRNDEEWAVMAKDGIIVRLGNTLVKGNYGRYWQIKVMVQNLSDSAFVFEPDGVTASLTTKSDMVVPLKVYTACKFQKKIKNQQAWSAALWGFAIGLNAWGAGYQTYNASSYVGGQYYTTAVTAYNASAASAVSMQGTGLLLSMGKQMEDDRRIRDEGYLKKNTIYPGEGIFGYMNIKGKRGKAMRISIPVNGTVFEFDWDVAKVKKAQDDLMSIPASSKAK